MSVIRKLVLSVSKRAREKRGKFFLEKFPLTPNSRILDLGSGDGSHIANILQDSGVQPKNVHIGDIDKSIVNEGHNRFGFTPVYLSESCTLPFKDKYFDVVFCSSVIEHVTVPKEKQWEMLSGNEFKEAALLRQKQLANEITRVGRSYFVQTPYKWFPVESHTWLPLVGYLPRELLVRVLRLSNSIWVKKTSPDWNLLSWNDMRYLFPDAIIHAENMFGLTKSLIAVKGGVNG